MKFGLL